MWPFKKREKRAKKPEQRQLFETPDSIEGSEFFDVAFRREMAQDIRPTEAEGPVLDLRPEGERDPKRVSHYYGEEGEIFYDILPVARQERPFLFRPSLRRPGGLEESEFVAVVSVLGVLILIGLALIYAAIAG